jgi:hypothetical protein
MLPSYANITPAPSALGNAAWICSKFGGRALMIIDLTSIV